MRREELFRLAKPYLEKNELGVTHTQRVLDIAKQNFNIPAQIREKVHALIILHDIGGSSVKEQYEKGPRIAEKLLRELGYDDEIIGEICEAIAKHHKRLRNPPDEFKILYDADQLAKFSREEFPHYESKNINWNSIMNSMYYEGSKALARKMINQRTRGR